MLFKFIHRLRARFTSHSNAEKTSTFEAAVALMRRGDLHGAIVAFRAHLKTDPYNVMALNDLGVCLSDTGKIQEASATFELAYSLDDTYVPVIVNHGKLLNDRRKSSEALPFLRQAKISEPEFSHVDAVFAGLCLTLGDPARARHFQLQAWLANFDNLRLANCYLFYGTYDDIDESLMAAEHRFWAETVMPLTAAPADLGPLIPKVEKKIRIGYWSPDLRNHSVRYFFRPLLENHDTAQFETYLYHDFPSQDAQTALLKAACSQFFDVSELSDADLCTLVKSHQLDILVELAGHSSNNRINLLQQRLATAQITGLGYPPTTGLKTIDAKVLDRYVVTPDSQRYYAEAPLVMPSSFWCFDPMEDAPITLEPPLVKNGYVTFGCIGNIAKITAPVLNCWCDLLTRVPDSQLLIRSISFEDKAALEAMQGRLTEAGFDMTRITLFGPAGGADFFGSYNAIDIVLDTFPFNGGTTTCFATYMGVPVVSMVGHSLVSRMGKSILSNLGVPGLVVEDTQAYTARAVALAGDIVFLQNFRREVRARFQESSLGNGKLFAVDFEAACKELLREKMSGVLPYRHNIPLLSANEIVKRAYAVLRRGQTEAAQRIVDHCLLHYPNSGSAHLLVTQLWTTEHRFEEAIDYLQEKLAAFTTPEQISVLIHLVRLNLLVDRKDQATQVVDRLIHMQLDDDFDRLQFSLYTACLTELDKAPKVSAPTDVQRHILILIPCDSVERFNSMQLQVQSICGCPRGWSVVYRRCNEAGRIAAYTTALNDDAIDVLVMAQKNLEIHNPLFFVEAAKALETCDVVGLAGATRWSRMYWRSDAFACKAAGFLLASSEIAGFVEVQWLGFGAGALVHDMAVLDGSLLAVNPKRLNTVEFDEKIISAVQLLEEDWTHTAYQAGLKLAVHRNLGVLIDQSIALDARYHSAGRVRCAEKLGFDPFAVIKDDNMLVSAPISSAVEAVQVCNLFLEMIP